MSDEEKKNETTETEEFSINTKEELNKFLQSLRADIDSLKTPAEDSEKNDNDSNGDDKNDGESLDEIEKMLSI